MNNDCIFCKIAKKEIPAYIIYEDEDVIVFLDKFPSSLGHTLVAPKKHFENIFELDEKLGEKIFKVVQKTAKVLKERLNISDLNILQNNGILAGQTVNHIHIHLIPRKENDNVNFSWKNIKPTDDEFEKMIDIIKF